MQPAVEGKICQIAYLPDARRRTFAGRFLTGFGGLPPGTFSDDA
jgi:hypothetical protein